MKQQKWFAEAFWINLKKTHIRLSGQKGSKKMLKTNKEEENIVEQ